MDGKQKKTINPKSILEQISKEKRNYKTSRSKKFNVGKLGMYGAKVRSTFLRYFWFSLEATSINKIVLLLHRPEDPSSLAIARILFGFLMMIDTLEERGFGIADIKWGDPMVCRFPLIDSLKPLPLDWMVIIYFQMLIAAFGMMVGWKYKTSCTLFAVSYWYIFLLDKSSWNNHSYMFGILAVLFWVSDADVIWSIDAWRGEIKNNHQVPLWNYAILRFQIFLLYFFAGLKKTDSDWLKGYSMASLSNHWVFDPLKYFFDLNNIDLWVVHVFGFIIDLTMGFFLYFNKTRVFAFLVLSSFHIMNSQMFQIGMFPFVCLVTLPLFCCYDWPKQLFFMEKDHIKSHINNNEVKNSKFNCLVEGKRGPAEPTRRQYFTVSVLCLYAALQLFLPYSHFLTKGYNNWTDGLYGYSWDMMVHNWKINRVTIKVIDRATNETMYIDPEAWVQNSRWQRHADMIVQYCNCVKKHLNELENMENISIFVDVWASLNNRIYQRMFDPLVDILRAHWSPFRPVSWLKPILHEYTPFRDEMERIEKYVQSWSNYSGVLFMADFSGHSLENFIHKDLENITLFVLKGKLSVTVENEITELSEGENMKILNGKFHQVYTLSGSPSAFMYSYINMTMDERASVRKKTGLPQWTESFSARSDNLLSALKFLWNAILRIFFHLQ